MPLEEALVTSADGDFGLVLIAFLIVALVGAFLWALKKIIDQNGKFNEQIIKQMQEIVNSIKGYQEDTLEALEKHDEQAKCVKAICQKTQTTLENRPCIMNDRK